MNSSKAKETNTVWTKLIPKDSKPRYGHSSTYYDNHSIDYCVYNIFGSDEKGNFCGDIFKFNMGDEKVEKIETNFGRHFHTATLFEDRIYIFGGKSNGYFNSILVFDLLSNKIEELKPHQEERYLPSKRFGHTALLFEDSIYIFGGYDNNSFYCNDMWKFNLVNHECVIFCAMTSPLSDNEFSVNNAIRVEIKSPMDITPNGRYHHGSVLFNKKMYIWGGRTESNTDNDNDIYIFDLIKETWEKKMVSQSAPSQRWGHVMVLSNISNFEGFEIHGGRNQKKVYDGRVSYMFGSNKWIKSESNKYNQLAPRYFHSMCSVGQSTVLSFGGRDSDHNLFNEYQILPIKICLVGLLPDDALAIVFHYFYFSGLLYGEGVCKDWQRLILNEWDVRYNLLRNTIIPSLNLTWIVFEHDKLFTTKKNMVRLFNCYYSNLQFQTSLPSHWDNVFSRVGALGRVREASIKEMYGEAYQKKNENPQSFEEHIENFNFKALLNEDANDRPLRVMLIGDINVGKTCVCVYCNIGHFPTEYIPTDVDLSGKMNEKITLFDSVHRGDYWNYFIKTMLPGKDIYFICFSVINPASYENVQKNWVPHAREHPNTEIMLIGTKADLANDLETRNRLKEKYGEKFEPISHNQGLQLAKEIGAMGYFETSAITGLGIKDAFTFAVEEYSRRRKMNENNHHKSHNKHSQRCVLQ